MGREIRRVPLDFDWPLEKVWDGFVNPHYRPCRAGCEGGYSATYRALARHVNALVWDRAVQTDPQYAKVAAFLVARDARPGPFGHDSIDAWSAVKRLGEMAELPEGWDTCQICGGEGLDPAAREAYEAWSETDPPAGEGWQMWETVSEGSPVSPVFATADALVDWLVNVRGYAWHAADAFVRSGWAPSFVVAGGAMGDGISMSAMMHDAQA